MNRATKVFLQLHALLGTAALFFVNAGVDLPPALLEERAWAVLMLGPLLLVLALLPESMPSVDSSQPEAKP